MRPLPVRHFIGVRIMICSYNDSQCVNQGYCNCRQDNTSEAAVGLGGLLIMLVVGIVASFLYPAIKILRSQPEQETNGETKFVGALWLFLSPLFGFLSNMLYQVVFAIGACGVSATQSRIAGSIYVVGMLLIYLMAIGLALLTFLFKNWQTIKLFFTEPETRNGNKTLTMAGAGIMALLIGLASLGIVAAATGGYFSRRAEINAETNRQEKIISADVTNYDNYIGKYKLITREDDTVFQVVRSDDGDGLRLSRYDEKDGGITDRKGCLLMPKLEGDAVYYAVSECLVDGKPSPLTKVYFEIRKTRTMMGFVYNVRTSGDELEKIR